jgi:hypothetical protein
MEETKAFEGDGPGPAYPQGMDRVAEPFTMARRRELVALAEKLVSTALEAGVKGREWCFLRQASELLADR